MVAKYLYAGTVNTMTLPKQWEKEKCVECHHFCGLDHYSYQRAVCGECKHYARKDNFKPQNF